MSAPDLPPPPEFDVHQRPLLVHLHVALARPEALRGGVVIVIDALRASVTMTVALANGAASIHPALTIDDARARARALRERLGPDAVVLGGERGGVRPEGFQVGNSPQEYAPPIVRGRAVAFSTTNGTAALLHAQHAGAERVLVGSFANLTAVCAAAASDPRPVHVLACGTRDQISLDDVLPAGAMVERFLEAGRELVAEDSGRVALAAWRGVGAREGPALLDALRSSRGGRNLRRIGLDADVDFCARVDSFPVVPIYRWNGEQPGVVRIETGATSTP